jgi:hypothetical protein
LVRSGDVRSGDEFAADSFLIPGSVRRDANGVEAWAPALAGKCVVVVCLDGKVGSQGVAAEPRHRGVRARILEEGY